MNKENLKKAYYSTDIDPTLGRLHELNEIADKYKTDGAQRLLCALLMKHMDTDDIERETVFISEAREKMEKELARLKKFQKPFNQEFATDHNEYYNTAYLLLKKIRSHVHAFAKVMKKGCPSHPTRKTCEKYGIKPKSVYDSSVFGNGVCQLNLFGLKDYFGPEAEGLQNEMEKFFVAMKESFGVCEEIIIEERDVRRDPARSKYLLEKYKLKAYNKLKNQIMLFTNETIEFLKKECPAYLARATYGSDEAFAQEEFHKHNTADMDHFCLIELLTAGDGLSIKEKVIWGNNPEFVKDVRYVIAHFDELLPNNFIHKEMGEYEYMFAKWALPANIKGAVDYFCENYRGQHKITKYGGANKHSKNYDKNSDKVKAFLAAINRLLDEKSDTNIHNLKEEAS